MFDWCSDGVRMQLCLLYNQVQQDQFAQVWHNDDDIHSNSW